MKMIVEETFNNTLEIEKKVTILNLEPFYVPPASSGSSVNTGMSYVIGNGVEDIAAGWKFFDASKVNMEITQIDLMADAAGSIVVDIWVETGSIPTVADSICATSKPALSSEQWSTQTVFVGWTVGIAVGDLIGIYVDSASGVKQVTLSILGEKT